MRMPKLADLIRTTEPGAPIGMEFNGTRRRLLVGQGRSYRRAPTFLPCPEVEPLSGTPKPMGVLNPVPLAEGLLLLKHVICKPGRCEDQPFWSRAYVRDGMVFGYCDGVVGVVQAAGLAGLEAMIHVADLGAVHDMVHQLNDSCTGHFVTQNHSLLTDKTIWLGLHTKPDQPFGVSDGLAHLLRCEPSDEILIPYNYFYPELERCVAATKGEPGAGLVRLQVKGMAPDARLTLRATDRPKLHRGFGELQCGRVAKLDAGWRTRVIDMHVKGKELLDLIRYFHKRFKPTNVGLEVLPSSAAFPYPVLRLREEVQGSHGQTIYTVQAFLVGTP
jgi:hypothetical protein